MTNISPMLEAMIKKARLWAFIDKQSLDKLKKHDPMDPFCITSWKNDEFHGKRNYRFSGNSFITTGIKAWIDENGEEIKSPRTDMWSSEQAEEVANQLRKLSLNAKVAKHIHDEPKEYGDIMLYYPVTSYYRNTLRYNQTPLYYLTIKTKIKTIDGKIGDFSFRIDSVGLPDIGQKVKQYLDAIESLAPENPEESYIKATSEIRNIIDKEYQKNLSFSDIESIKRINDSSKYEIILNTKNVLFEDSKDKVVITFHGTNAEDIWKPIISVEKGTFESLVSNDASRKKTIEENGGLKQTTLAKNIIEYAGLDPNPIGLDYKGNARKIRSGVGTNPSTDFTLEVKSGRIEATIKVDGKLKITTGRAIIYDAVMPEAQITAIKDKSLDQIISHPLISDDIVVTSAKQKDGDIHLNIRMGTELVKYPD